MKQKLLVALVFVFSFFPMWALASEAQPRPINFYDFMLEYTEWQRVTTGKNMEPEAIVTYQPANSGGVWSVTFEGINLLLNPEDNTIAGITYSIPANLEDQAYTIAFMNLLFTIQSSSGEKLTALEQASLLTDILEAAKDDPESTVSLGAYDVWVGVTDGDLVIICFSSNRQT